MKQPTPEQKEKYIELSKHLGEELDYMYRGKYRKVKLIAVSLPERVITTEPGLRNKFYSFRVLFISRGTEYWTTNIDRIKLPETE